MSETQNDVTPVKPHSRGRATRWLGLVGVVLVVVLVNAVVGVALKSVRMDLTQEKLYSLSPAVGPWLQTLDEPVEVELFVSREALVDLPSFRAYATRVQEFLEEMQRASRGKLSVRVLDPEPFSEAEDLAQSAGLQPASTGQVGQTLTFGVVVTNSVDEQQTLPFLDPRQEATLEYDLMRAICTVALPDKPRVAVVSALPLAGGGSAPPSFPGMPPQRGQPYAAYQQLEQLYDVQQVDPTARSLPDDLDCVVLAHPAGLSDKLLKAIDRYAYAGGRLLVFYDPLCESAASGGAAGGGAATASDLGPLLTAWGLEVTAGQAVADPAFAQRVQARSAGGLQVVPMLSWLGLTQDAVAEPSPLTRSLQFLRAASMGVVSRSDQAPEPLTFTPLLHSTDQASLADVTSLGAYADPTALLRSHIPTGERYVVAAQVRGQVARAYAADTSDEQAPASGEDNASADGDDPPNDNDAPQDQTADDAVTPGAADVVLVADADLLADRFWIEDGGVFGLQATADNGSFLLGAVEYLTGNPVLSELRPRMAARRPFTRIQAIQRAAEDAYLAEEQRLQDEVDSTEQRLSELLAQAPPDRNVLTLNDEQQAEIEKLQDQMLTSRKALRGVQYELRRNIDRLGQLLMLLNVAAWPALVAVLAALGLALRWKNSHAHR